MEFYKSIIPQGYNPDQFIMVMNDPTREYYKVYEIKNYRNTIEGINWKYLNLPNDELKASALASIKNNEPLYTSCDVGKQNNGETGILDVNNYDYQSLFGIKLSMDKKARILTRQSGSSHAMLLVACDTDENDKPVKWEFENSWGASAGHNGYLTFTDEWFNEYMFRMVLNKKYLSSKAIEGLKGKSIMLPVWDYMF
jgi:bleomycin hydrolase